MVSRQVSTVDQVAAPAGPPPSLRGNRDFLLLWSGAGFAVLGARVSTFAYPLLVLWHGGTPAVAGLVTFAALLPNLLVQLPAGVMVDRWDRRRLMILSDAGCCTAAASVALAVFLGGIWLPHLLIAAFVGGSLAIVYELAERGGVRNLVAAEQLPMALSRNEARSRAAALLGQPAGGLLLTFARWMPFLFTMLAHLASLLTLLMIRRPFQAARVEPGRRPVAAAIEGLTWTWRQRFLRTVVGLIAATNLLFFALVLALMVIVEEAGRPPVVVGLITAAGGLGGAFGAATSMWWRRRVGLRAIVVGTMLVWAVLMPWVAVVRNPVVLGAIFAGMTYAGGVVNVAGVTYQIQVTPDALQGRVSSVLVLIGSGASSVGALAGGLVLDAVGVTPTVLGVGGVMAVLAVLSALSPAVRTGDRSLVAPLGRQRVPR